MPISPEQKEELTQRILEVTERQIAENGLAAVSTRSIAREAGCSGGSIYTRFSDFDDLVLAVNSRALARFGAVLDRLAAEAGNLSIEDRLIAMAFAYLDFALSERNSWSALFEHRLADGDTLPDWHRRDHLRLFAYIEAPLLEFDPELTEEQAGQLARTLYSAVHGIVSVSIEDRLGRVETEVLRRQIAVVLQGIAAGWRQVPPSRLLAR
ncbi:TetR/AcrR family transcriptional regulator [Rhizobium sp. YJ-22]|uniref:TetR/AcrR family transcriptional regulator n=1 Tax=Rhizobium sp. YJ-22 TaxID=3037556 RepID=UPI001AD44979|nr:TetR/AcrR family transcriptional regulator [Rhizobium sp. YJ-22]MBN9033652.1 TetR/AcrR family transcriptional regulator [Hyphomicrobiales bacterium]MDG3579139.1 TetR/AcrR family transcriptional regulator [Rhizobium sp. YJ-22]